MKIKATVDQVNKALAAIRKAGELQMEGSSGSFSVKGVEGRFMYDQDEEMLTIRIDDKPWLASESMIESEIRKFFTN